MSVKYRKIKRKVLNGPDKGKIKTYAIAKPSHTCDIERLCELISARTKMWNTEVKSVVEALIWVMQVEMTNGGLIQLEPFGSFYYNIQSAGAEKEEDFTVHHIKGVKLVFYPSKKLRNISTNVKFSQAAVIKEEGSNEEPNPFPG